MSEVEVGEWELCKENAQPLKKGRSVAQQPIGGFVSAAEKANMEELRQQYEERLSEASLTLSEKLDIYVQYYTWIRRTATSNMILAKALLEVGMLTSLHGSLLFHLYTTNIYRNARKK